MKSELIEYRRKRVVALIEEGTTQLEVARVLGMSTANVCNIWKMWQEHGEAGLESRLHERGRKSKLSPAQKAWVKAQVSRPATEHGFENDLWTRPRVAQAILDIFNIELSLTSIGTLLRELGFSYKKPTVKDRRQDPEKVAAYKRDTLAEVQEAIKKNMK